MTSWWGSFPRLHAELAQLLLLSHAESTNDEAKALVSEAFSGVLTDNQSAGRGRLGRSWDSTPGQGVALSVTTPPVGSQSRSWLPLLVGAAVAQGLTSLGVLNARVKWPNDVLVDGGKIAGILCEVLPSGHVVIGLGLNVQFSSKAAPIPGARALDEMVPLSHELVDGLLGAVIGTVKSHWSPSGGPDNDTVKSFVSSHMGTLEMAVSIANADGSKWDGVASSLTDEGHLVVEESLTGKFRTVVAADVTHLWQ